MPQAKSMRLPTSPEWDLLVMSSRDIHWIGMYSWCTDVTIRHVPGHAARGCLSPRHWQLITTMRDESVGFRPAVADKSDIPDGTTITTGTLYMDGEPIKVPVHPTWGGDVPDYIPRAALELREPLADPAYQVKAIKVGNILIADRVLIKRISYGDLAEQGLCC